MCHAFAGRFGLRNGKVVVEVFRPDRVRSGLTGDVT